MIDPSVGYAAIYNFESKKLEHKIAFSVIKVEF
jgi:hypothetical protein